MKVLRRQRRITAVLASIVLVVAMCIPIMISNGNVSAKDEKDYIGDVLGKYQYFVEGDVSNGGHTVGAIAVGGTYEGTYNGTTNYFGDVSIVPSYIGTYKSGGIGNGWNGTLPEGLEQHKEVYYGKLADGSEIPNDGTKWVQDAEYIDMQAYFMGIRVQAAAIAENGIAITDAQIKNDVLTLTCKDDDTYFNLPYEVFSKVREINIEIPDGDIDWLHTHICAVSITGDGKVEVNGKLEDGNDAVAFDDWTKIRINGVHMSQALESMSGQDAAYNKQLNFAGMNLLFNFPDVTGTIALNGLGGHLVAPNAKVDIGGADYEGSIIAKELVGTAQGHFYPFSGKLVKEEPSTEEPSTEEPSTEEPSTEEPSTEKPSTEEPSTEKPSTEEPSTEKPSTEEPSTERPSTEEPSTEKPNGKNNGELLIVVYDEKTGDVVPGATVKVTYPDGSSKNYDTDSGGEIILSKLPSGKYKVEVVSVPDGYTVTTGNVQNVSVTDGERADCEVYIAAENATTVTTTETTTTENTTEGNNKKPSTSVNNQVKTGDSFNIIIPVGIMVCAIAGAIILIIRKKKSEDK